MDCTLINVDIYDGYYVDYRHKNMTSKRIRKCCECDRDIMPGEEFEFYIGKNINQTRIDIWRTCVDCLSVRYAFFDSWQFTTLWETLEEHIEDGYLHGKCLSDAILQLTNKARDLVQEIIAKYEGVW